MFWLLIFYIMETMRKILKRAIVLAGVLYAGIVSGQGTGTLYTALPSGLQSIVRHDQTTGKYISCSALPGYVVHFFQTDMNLFIDVKVAENVVIKDFEIIGRYVFFCGNDGSGSGMIGWFHIDSLFSMNVPVHIDRTLVNLGLVSLDNIEVYLKDAKTYCVAGYGPESGGGYLAFEAIGDPLTSMSYRTLLLKYENNSYQIVDMTVTDNYVVYLGEVRSSFCDPHYGYGITLYPFPKSDMFSLPLLADYFFHTTTLTSLGSRIYPENMEPYWYSNPKIVTVENDKVAVCAHRRDIDFMSCAEGFLPGTVPCLCDYEVRTNTYLALRTYDLSPLSSSQPIAMLSADAAELYPGEATMINDFKYSKKTGTFVALHYHQPSACVYDYAVTTFDYSSGSAPAYAISEYQQTYNTINIWHPTSLCLDYGYQYTISGFDCASWNYYFWQNYLPVSTSNVCVTTVGNPIIELPLMPHKEGYNPNMPSSWLPLVFSTPEDRIVTKGECTAVCN